MQSKVLIRLTKVGNRPGDVLKVLQKIQGLRDIPENLIKDAPCDISQKVTLALAQKVQTYLERAGAMVNLHEEEWASSVETRGSEPTDDALNTLTSHFVSVHEDETGAAVSDMGSSNPLMEEDITYFDVEESNADTELPTYPETDFDEAQEVPSPKVPSHPVRRTRATAGRHSAAPAQYLRLIGVVLLVAAVLAGGFWFYVSGGLSRVTNQYQQGTTPGGTGTVIIENPSEADVALHRLVATRVSEPVQITGPNISLAQGDYFLEAKLGGQTLYYPIYIAGRGHKLRVTVEFPDSSIPQDMAYIPAGWFRIGNKETDIAHFGFPDEVPSVDMYVGAFLMSQYEVTNREYAQFIEEGGYSQAVYWDELINDWDSLVRQSPDYGRVFGNSGWEAVSRYIRTTFIDTDRHPGPRLWEDDIPPYDDGQADFPVTGITYYEAAAFCKWVTQKKGRVYRLPTEAEWEKAARSYEGYFFSYGNEYDATRANTESEGPQRVGSYPPNGFGVYDLTGNVWEWVSDHYRADAYQFLADTYDNDIRNPRIFNAAQAYDRRILRGGSFRSVNRINAKTTIRYPMFPNDWHTNIGFRYVTTP